MDSASKIAYRIQWSPILQQIVAATGKLIKTGLIKNPNSGFKDLLER